MGPTKVSTSRHTFYLQDARPISGQLEERGRVNPRGDRALLDAYGRCDTGAVAQAYHARRAAADRLAESRASVENAARDREYLTHAVDELTRFAPEPGEEPTLAEERATQQKGARLSGDTSAVHIANAQGREREGQ